MTPIINPWVFYAIDVVDGLKMIAALGIACIISVIAVTGIFAVIEFDILYEVTDKCKKLTKIIKRLIVILIALAMFCVLVPGSKTITKMVIAQNVTYERVGAAADNVQKVYEDFMELLEKDNT